MKHKAICVDNTDTNLILYKQYLIEECSGNYKFLKVYDNNYHIMNIFRKDKFRTMKEIRQNKLNKLEI